MQILLMLVTILIGLFILYVRNYQHTVDGFLDNASNSYEIPRITWSYWEGEPMPELVKLAHERRQKKLTGWTVNLLTPETLPNYIDISTTPTNYNTLSPQHKADWIRVALLKKYGGVWLDSTIIINDGKAISTLAADSEAQRSEFTGFTAFCDKSDTSYIENWFMMAPKGSELINKLCDEYTQAITLGFDNYKNALATEHDIKISPSIYKFGLYLTQHSCIQAVIQKRLGRTPRMLLNRAEESMFKLHTECNFDNTCIGNKMLEPSTRTIPYLKLSNGSIKFDHKAYFSDSTEHFYSGKRIDWAK